MDRRSTLLAAEEALAERINQAEILLKDHKELNELRELVHRQSELLKNQAELIQRLQRDLTTLV